MTTLLTLIPLPYRLLALALLCVAVWGHGWLKGAHHGEAKLAAFEVAVRAEGSAAQKLANDRISRERAKTDDTNAKYLAADAGRRATAERLRKYADTPGYIVPRTATDTGVVETRACFDQRAVDDAIRTFATGTASLVGEGEALRIRLDNAINWANAK